MNLIVFGLRVGGGNLLNKDFHEIDHRHICQDRKPSRASCRALYASASCIEESRVSRFQKLVPMLQTMDMGQTIAWYETVLGFRRTGQQADGWCCLSRDGVSLMFMTNAHLGPPHATATQYVTVDDVDALWEGIKEHCQAEWGPEDMPYGLREFAIKDPNGYLLSFGSPIHAPLQSN